MCKKLALFLHGFRVPHRAFPKLLALAARFAIAGSVAIRAQSSSGRVRGTVNDPSGAVIPGAVVELENPV